MSNIIPIVSSSPPPMEESGFGWDDDDDDDFGNFASAPTAGSAISSDSSFDVQWSTSQISLPAIEDEAVEDIENKSNCPDLEQTSKGNIEPVLSGQAQNDCVDAENFADFENNFQEFPPIGTVTSNLASGDGKTISKPESIAIRNSSIEELDHQSQDEHSDQCGRTMISTVNESVYSNASTTDSGVFSSDLSPGPLPADSSDLCQKIPSLDTCHSTEGNSASKESLDSAVDVTSPHSSGESESKSLQQASNAEHKQQEKSSFDVQGSGHQTKLSQPLNDSEGNKDEGNDWGNFGSAFRNESNSCSVITQQDVSAFSDADTERESSPGQSAITTTHSPKTDSQESDQEDDHVISTKNDADESTSISTKNDTETEERDLSHSDNSISDLNSKISPLNSAASNVEEQEKGPDISPCEKSTDAVCDENEKSAGSESIGDTVRCEDSAVIANVSQTTCDSNNHSDEEDDGWGDFDSGGTEEPQTNSSANSESKHSEEEHLHMSRNDSEHFEVRDNIPKKDLNTSVRSASPSVEERTEQKTAFNSGCDDTLGDSDKSDSNKSEHIRQTLDATDITAKVEDDGKVPVDSGTRAEHEGEDEEFGSFLDHRERKESDPSEEVAPITFRTSVCEPDVTNEGEDDFDFNRHNPPPFSDEVEEDDDEFGDFGQADQWDSNNGEDKSKDNTFPKSAGDDNFGDFGSNAHGGDNDEDGAGWADFGTASTSEASTTADGFGDFSHNEAAPTPSLKVGTEQSKLARVEQALQKCFQSDEAAISETESTSKEGKATTCGPSPLDSVVQLGTINPEEVKHQTWTVVQHPAKRDPKVKIWGQLKDVDSSHALVFGWSNSHCSKEVFSTLHIDTQNVLFSQKKQAVPFFASGIGILEPIRGGVDNRKEKKATPVQPVLLDTSKPDVKPISGSSQDALPPVDFDWSTSGLTNPLSDEWDWVFKADQPDQTRSSLQPLEEMMRHSTPTAKLATHEVLSPEAMRVLEKMPDLSFMQSRVLMFPVKN